AESCACHAGSTTATPQEADGNHAAHHQHARGTSAAPRYSPTGPKHSSSQSHDHPCPPDHAAAYEQPSPCYCSQSKCPSHPAAQTSRADPDEKWPSTSRHQYGHHSADG